MKEKIDAKNSSSRLVSIEIHRNNKYLLVKEREKKNKQIVANKPHNWILIELLTEELAEMFHGNRHFSMAISININLQSFIKCNECKVWRIRAKTTSSVRWEKNKKKCESNNDDDND